MNAVLGSSQLEFHFEMIRLCRPVFTVAEPSAGTPKPDTPKQRKKRIVLPDEPVYHGMSDTEQLVLHHFLHRTELSESLLAIKNGTGEAIHAIEWMFSPDFIDRIEKIPGARSVYVRRHQTDIPFSFYNCCISLKYDPAAIRAGIANLLPTLPWIKGRLANSKTEKATRGMLVFVKQFSDKEKTNEVSFENFAGAVRG